jgi:TonB family protein
MSAVRQVRARESEAISPADPEKPIAPPDPQAEDPLRLLRDAIDQLKSSNGSLPDQTQVANLLAEAREALERAKMVAHALAECEERLKEGKFDQAFEALDAGLAVYPGDPALVRRRGEVEQEQKRQRDAAAARAAIDEANFLIGQDRLDLAAQFLREKVEELPDEVDLNVRLKEVQALLPEWERKRDVEDTLARVAKLEQLEQWQAALTVLEVAMQSHPASEELFAAATRVQEQLLETDRRRKLTRRLELIGQNIASQSWKQALKLVEDARKEFPDTAELNSLETQTREGLKRAECDAVVTEVHQYLSGGELDQAEKTLLNALMSLGPEPALDALLQELDTDRKFQADLRTAQVLFGRRELAEAERILTQWIAPNRPEAQALLDAVRQARLANDEENLCERGRQKAAVLIQQQQFAQAADLLRNLLSLFPGNPLLERELAVAQRGLEDAAAAAPRPVAPQPSAAKAAEAPAPAQQAQQRTTPEARRPRFSRLAIAGAASLLLVSGAGAVWKMSQSAAPGAKTATTPTQIPPASQVPATQTAANTAPAPAAALPEPTVHAPAQEPPSQRTTATAPPKATTRATSPSLAVREFVPIEAKPAPRKAEAQLPAPPSAGPLVPSPTLTTPSQVVQLANPPAPPPSAPPAAPSASAPAQSKQAAPQGGRFKEAQLLVHKMPEYPSLAREFRASGVVRLQAEIDETGTVKNVVVVSGHPILAAAAKTAVLNWKYKAATLNEKPIPTSVQIQISFTYENK